MALVVLAASVPLTGGAVPPASADPSASVLTRSVLTRSVLTSAALAAALPADPGGNGKFGKLNAQIERLDKAYGGDLAKLKDAQFAAKTALDKSKVLQSDLDGARDLVARMAASQYMTGGQDPTIAVLSADSPSDLLSNATLISHVAQNKAARVEQIKTLVDQQSQARKQAQEKIAELQKEIKDLLSQKTRIRNLVKKYKPESPSVGMGGVTPRMLKVKNTIDTEMGPFPTIGCVRTGGDPQDHATGRACDFMVTTGGVMASGGAQALGDRTAAYAIAHASALGIKYIIWRQRIYDLRSPGWRGMENRGGVTANHYDHVHISVF
ncbi:coiled-coil domain-containing protein [Actinomadura roseirufa]|uniref:coiled-coil domain-containing protein n=1 Tax=Actinomadura roseirufa TaxID=2094049 RepID=UPI001040E1C5|nr:hypothetical protein [Actinomadura roseirufa]